MTRVRAHAEELISARPTAVYAVLANYTTHHPRIMPPSQFSDLEVETGGIGEGTVFHITLRIAGKEQRLHMQVAEPEPGHVLTETNLDTGVITMFSVAPGNDGKRARTQISSEWETAGGLRRLADRFVVPQLMGRIFTKQLHELNQYMRSGDAPT